MTFTRKEWVNVPDPSKLPPVPEGQDSLARFDAENMNRIENGIEEATHNVAKHTHSAEDVGLANVPNVTTNDQTPTYTEATTLTNLISGEKISIAFGKIKKAITDFISHNEDTTKHITSTERTTWNNKADESHNHSKSQITDFPTSMTPTAHTHTKSQITDFPTSMPASDVSSWAKQSTKPKYTATEVGAATTITLTSSLVSISGSSWTSENGWYKQNVYCSGLLLTDYPIMDVILDKDISVAKQQLEAWSSIMYADVTNNDYITLYTDGTIPKVAFQISVKVVR